MEGITDHFTSIHANIPIDTVLAIHISLDILAVMADRDGKAMTPGADGMMMTIVMHVGSDVPLYDEISHESRHKNELYMPDPNSCIHGTLHAIDNNHVIDDTITEGYGTITLTSAS